MDTYEQLCWRSRALEQENDPELEKQLQPLRTEWRPYYDQMSGILDRAEKGRRGLTNVERSRYRMLEGRADLLERRMAHEKTWFRLQRCPDTPTVDPRPTISRAKLRSRDWYKVRRLEAVALHEAAHAVIMVLEGIPVVRARLTADGGGFVTPGSTCSAAVYLAGQVAVQIAKLDDTVPKGFNEDDDRKAMKQLGSFFSIKRMRDRVELQLRWEWAAVLAVSRALLKHGELSGEDAETIIRANLSYAAKNRIRRAA